MFIPAENLNSDVGGYYILRKLQSSNDITHHAGEPRLFRPRQDGRQFWVQPANFERLKKTFSLIVREKKS
jgi:hypothetical protein